MMECNFVATAETRKQCSKAGCAIEHEHKCSQCGFVRWSKYADPRLIHRECLQADGTVSIEQGPGTELKKLLASYGITSEAGCGCDDHAREMNRRGVEWCKANIETIVDWMQEEAAKRKLPFIAMAARWLVRRAIRASS